MHIYNILSGITIYWIAKILIMMNAIHHDEERDPNVKYSSVTIMILQVKLYVLAVCILHLISHQISIQYRWRRYACITKILNS